MSKHVMRVGVGVLVFAAACGQSGLQSSSDEPTRGPDEHVSKIDSALVIPSGSEFAPNVKWGGRVQAVAVDPNNLNFVIAASDNGGAWLSNDGAKNWTHLTEVDPIVRTRSEAA
jgi:hypothetical protein